MGCNNSKPEEVAAPPPTPDVDAAAAQKAREFKEKQKKMEAERQAKVEEEEAKQREAKEAQDKAEKEANEAAAEAIANQLAAELAEKKLAEARLAEEAARQEQERQVMESFKGMGAKLRFRAAVKEGKMDVAEDAAASMLQGAWRAKCARRKMQAKRAERQRLMEEGCARKLQSLYRCRLARKRVAAKREEKRQLIAAEEARRVEAEAARAAALKASEVKVEVLPELKKGFIKKEGQFIKSTKNRFFVLRRVSSSESTLTYYASERAEAPFGSDEKGNLSLKGAKLNDPVGLTMVLSSAEGRDLKMSFETAAELASWKAALEEHLEYSNKKFSMKRASAAPTAL